MREFYWGEMSSALRVNIRRFYTAIQRPEYMSRDHIVAKGV